MLKTQDRPDAMDLAAGLAPDGPIAALRAERPEFLFGAQECRRAVIDPQDDLGLSTDLRTAIARRVALTSDNPCLIEGYPLSRDAGLVALATGDLPDDPRLAALAAHTDMIARDPGRSRAEDLVALQDVGFSVPQIIALSELLAYACFEIRVAHGLSLLEAQT